MYITKFKTLSKSIRMITLPHDTQVPWHYITMLSVVNELLSHTNQLGVQVKSLIGIEYFFVIPINKLVPIYRTQSKLLLMH